MHSSLVMESAAGVPCLSVMCQLQRHVYKGFCLFQSGNPVLNWARTQTRMACQVAPAKAPAGQEVATFAGMMSLNALQTHVP